MTAVRVTIILFLITCVEACAFHHYALNPPPGNTSWTPTDQSVIVLVGFESDEPIGSLYVRGDTEGISIASNLFPSNELNVVAVHFRSGEQFELTAASFLVSSATATYSLSFEDTPSLTLGSPGIYYYGKFTARQREGYFTPKPDERVVTKARMIYPGVFTALQPRNF